MDVDMTDCYTLPAAAAAVPPPGIGYGETPQEMRARWEAYVDVPEQRDGRGLDNDETRMGGVVERRPCHSEEDGDGGPPREMTLLSLPLEIRLEIYHWIYLLNPVRPLVLAPGLATPRHTAYHQRPVRNINNSSESASSRESSSSPPPPSTSSSQGQLDQDRPFCYIPSTFLRTSRQIYHEVRTLPFAGNEFAFQQLFTSGLPAAWGFTRMLMPWQLDALRWARIEVQERELLTGDDKSSSSGGSSSRKSTRLQKWVALCTAWSRGLRGLRLRIVAMRGVQPATTTTAATITSTDGSDKDEEHEGEEKQDNQQEVGEQRRESYSGVGNQAWVRDGLMAMKHLQRLEVELDGDMTDDDKIAWCDRLGHELRTSGGLNVTVECMKKETQHGEINDDLAEAWSGLDTICEISETYEMVSSLGHYIMNEGFLWS